MLKFASDHPNTKKKSKNAVKKLLFAIMYVSDQFETY